MANPPLRAVVIPVTPLQQNATLLWCTKTRRGAITDPGGDLDRLLAAARTHGVTVEKLLVTHGHIDHCGETGVLARRLGVPIEGPHPEDEFWIRMNPLVGAQYGVPGAEAFTPDRWLFHGDRVRVGEVELDVYHCPGHTPGHVVFHHPASRLAIVGDVLFQGSIGRTDFPRGDHAALIRSIRTHLWPLGDDTVFIPGHGPPSTFGHERRTNPFVGDFVV
ncbi:MAG: MBL fold metallo-hydrolase [Sphingomonadaceae bacterium]|uniref:MBL fold metallo-hydrolase n=1 Tax=Thermaurantiacus sp. TaxID=2820283 RepID=UPI00298F27D0|nr:MBL fold metallo-hydrolase [Thermaurantiacus sp.]MCS6987071.1 MBL fold metallo-hydrolase [Sphingomonadaceae bacterium]MDW8415591.1 MBL fold metallo-hydrolase [Thermaurantiacus sp.]